jgi:beta-lactam-binding protein with PASTA domain
MVAVIATSVAVLAIIGATGGYLLANTTTTAEPTTSATPTASAPAPSASAEASASPSYSPTSMPSSGTLPPGVGADFREYFTQLRELKLGVTVIFGEAGEPGKVIRTEPAAGAPIRNGLNIKVYAAGEPPVVEVPTVLGMKCRTAGGATGLGKVGLLPSYSGEDPDDSVVIAQSPDPATGGTAHWNDRVALTCGQPTSPSPSPAP